MSDSYGLKARTEILKKNITFFKCLKPGHAKPNCKSTMKCYKCKKRRRLPHCLV